MYPKKLTKLIITVITASTVFLSCLLSACIVLEKKHVHNPQYVAAAEATCESNGNKAYYKCECGACFSADDIQTEINETEVIIPRKAHSFTSYGFNENEHYLQCAECGFIKARTESSHILKYYADDTIHYRYCTLCDYRTESEEHVPDEEGAEFCKVCRYRRADFQLSDNGEYYICTGATQAFKDLVTELVIPDTYLGLPVKEVGDRAFTGCPNLEKITLGQNVISIGEYAFMDNTRLKTVEFNDGLLEIQFRAFHGCTALEEVTLPSGLINAGNGIFYGCAQLKKVNIPQSLKTISERMFYECYALETVELHNGITSIGTAAFSRTGLKEFVFCEGITAVPQTVFYDCEYLEKVTLPASVTSIGSGAFMDCPALKTIEFEGTAEQWENVQKANLWDRNSEFTVTFIG